MKARLYLLLALGLLINISLKAQQGVFENVSYTDQGNVSVVESFAQEGDRLEPLKRISYEYDSQGECSLKSLEKWDADRSTWVKVAKTAYDNTNKSITNFAWNNKSKQWTLLEVK